MSDYEDFDYEDLDFEDEELDELMDDENEEEEEEEDGEDEEEEEEEGEEEDGDDIDIVEEEDEEEDETKNKRRQQLSKYEIVKLCQVRILMLEKILHSDTLSNYTKVNLKKLSKPITTTKILKQEFNERKIPLKIKRRNGEVIRFQDKDVDVLFDINKIL